MGVIGRFYVLLCVTMFAMTCVAPDAARARGGGSFGGGAHFGGHGAHAASHGARFTFNNTHLRIGRTRAIAGFGLAHGRGHAHNNSAAAFGAWELPWGWSYETEAAPPSFAAVEPASLPRMEENPALLPPCHETQFGVAIVRGKSCRA